jgi:hypothetical protein
VEDATPAPEGRTAPLSRRGGWLALLWVTGIVLGSVALRELGIVLLP